MKLPDCVARIIVVPNFLSNPFLRKIFLKTRCAVWLSRPLKTSSNRAIFGLEYTALANALVLLAKIRQ